MSASGQLSLTFYAIFVERDLDINLAKGNMVTMGYGYISPTSAMHTIQSLPHERFSI